MGWGWGWKKGDKKINNVGEDACDGKIRIAKKSTRTSLAVNPLFALSNLFLFSGAGFNL